MIEHGFDKAGGFIVLNTDAKLWWYAYPTSTYAHAAKRKAAGVAAEMAGHASFDQRLLVTGKPDVRDRYDAQYHRLFLTLHPPVVGG